MKRKTTKKSVSEFNAVEMAHHIIGLLDCTLTIKALNKMIRDLQKWRSIGGYRSKQAITHLK